MIYKLDADERATLARLTAQHPGKANAGVRRAIRRGWLAAAQRMTY